MVFWKMTISIPQRQDAEAASLPRMMRGASFG
jgi:hypothetical protein